MSPAGAYDAPAGTPFEHAMTTTEHESPPRPLADHELAAWRGMLQAHAAMTRALDAQMHDEHGLSLSAYEVLMFLGDAPAPAPADDGDRRARAAHPQRLTRLVDRLVELGYATRCAAENDGRGLYAQLTDTGAAALDAARRTHRQGVRQHFLDRLTLTDQLALADIWTRFQDR